MSWSSDATNVGVHLSPVFPQQAPVDRSVPNPLIEVVWLIGKSLAYVPVPPALHEGLASQDQPVDLDVRIDDNMKVGRADRVGGPGRPPVGLVCVHVAHRPFEPVPRLSGLSSKNVDLRGLLAPGFSHQHLH